MSDLFQFSEKDEEERELPVGWNILIVDDDDHIHEATGLALNDFEFRNRTVQLFHTKSKQETIEFFKNDDSPEIAIVFLDVIMETRHAGLELIDYIRTRSPHSRIIIRTGQPGVTPEKDVIVKYDIDGYKEKGELTSQKLFSTVVASLRAYENLITLDKIADGLEGLVSQRSDEILRVNYLIEALRKILFEATTTAPLSHQLEQAAENIVNKPGTNSTLNCCVFTIKDGERSLLKQKCSENQDCLNSGECVCNAIHTEFPDMLEGSGEITFHDKKLCFVIAPLRCRGHVHGTINVVFNEHGPDEIKFVGIIGHALSTIIDKSSLLGIINNLHPYDMSTNLPKRAIFDEDVESKKSVNETFDIVHVSIYDYMETGMNMGFESLDRRILDIANALLKFGPAYRIQDDIFAVICQNGEDVVEDLKASLSKIGMDISIRRHVSVP